jgi:hypothetical protein
MKTDAAILPQAAARRPMELVLTLGLLGLSLLLLMVVQPYAAGYGNFRMTILQELLMRWKDPTWQHGALAPLIAGWLVWMRRSDLARTPVRPWVPGWAVVIFSLLFYLAGYKANNFYLGAAAVMGLLAGWVLACFGWEHARRLFFPWLMLIFMWPLVFLEESLGFHLRMVMVKGVSALLNAVHLETVRDGTALLSAPAGGRALGELFTLRAPDGGRVVCALQTEVMVAARAAVPDEPAAGGGRKYGAHSSPHWRVDLFWSGIRGGRSGKGGLHLPFLLWNRHVPGGVGRLGRCFLAD